MSREPSIEVDFETFKRRKSDRGLDGLLKRVGLISAVVAAFFGALGVASPYVVRALGLATKVEIEILHSELHGFFERMAPGSAIDIHNQAAKNREE